MISIRTYSEIDKQNWKSLVETSPVATWFQTDEAYRFYQSVSDMDAFVYGVVEEDRLVGVIVGYTTQEKCVLKQYFTARTIVVGGPLLDENISESALAMLLQIVKKQQGEAIYIETRNLHDYSRWRIVFEANGFAYQPHLNIQVACHDQHSMSEQRQRQVKKAIKMVQKYAKHHPKRRYAIGTKSSVNSIARKCAPRCGAKCSSCSSIVVE